MWLAVEVLVNDMIFVLYGQNCFHVLFALGGACLRLVEAFACRSRPREGAPSQRSA